MDIHAHNFIGSATLSENTAIILDPALSADGKYTGIVRTGTAGSANMVWSGGSNLNFHLAIAVKEYQPSLVKTFNGLASASVKTFNGLA